MKHYFTDNQDLPSQPVEQIFYFASNPYSFLVDAGVFSKSQIDYGTRILLEVLIQEQLQGTLLDLGCGYGAIGKILKHYFPQLQITCCDINSRAVWLATKNAPNCKVLQSDGFANVKQTFNTIVSNPPIRVGKAKIYEMFMEAYQHLEENGRLYLVIRKQQGAQSAMNYLTTVFGNCKCVEKDSGYWILLCTKN